MAGAELVEAIRAIVTTARSGDVDAAYRGYRELFESPGFRTNDAKDQRQALKLMIHAKGSPPSPTPSIVDAHRAAAAPLVELVSAHGEPADHEMLGMCHLMMGDEAAAGASFRTALTIERERNAQSDLCGILMKRVSML